MIISTHVNQYNNKCIYFCEALKNTIISGGYFIRLLYSTENITLNGIHMNITFNKGNYDINNNKLKLHFNIQDNRALINHLNIIEEQILNKYNNSSKKQQHKLTEQLNNGSIRIFTENNEPPIIDDQKVFILKIAGVWEDPVNYGITYKFIKVTHQW